MRYQTYVSVLTPPTLHNNVARMKPVLGGGAGMSDCKTTLLVLTIIHSPILKYKLYMSVNHIIMYAINLFVWQFI